MRVVGVRVHRLERMVYERGSSNRVPVLVFGGFFKGDFKAKPLIVGRRGFPALYRRGFYGVRLTGVM